MPSPSSSQPFRHLLIVEDQKAKRIVTLEESTYSLGRDASNSVILYDQQVSRHHATLLRVTDYKNNQNAYRIIDGNLEGKKSTNGIAINGRYCLSHELKHGDLITFGGKAQASYQIISDASSVDHLKSTDGAKSPQVIPKEEYNPTLTSNEGEQLSREELSRLASFPELSPHPIVEINWEGKVTYLNPAASVKFKDLDGADLEHPILRDLISAQTQQGLIVREIQVGQEVFEQYVHYLQEAKLVRSYLFDFTKRKQAEAQLQDSEERYRTLARQASERKSEENRQEHSVRDRLTGLPNQALFREQLAIALDNAKSQQHLMAVLLLDFQGDRSEGVGDHLEEIAANLKSSVRSADIVARWQGNQFGVLLPRIGGVNEVTKVSKRILKVLKQPSASEQVPLLSINIGVAVYPQDGEAADVLLKNASIALARTQPKPNSCQFYSSSENSKASALVKLETLLHQALEKKQFSLHYQPQINANTGTLSGMEALLRWHHPELGQVPPAKFIPLAEETDLIIPLGKWVLQNACAQNKAWQKAGLPPIRVSVNLSPRQFQAIPATVSQVLQQSGLEPWCLELEVTETAISQNVDLARKTLENLQRLGVYIALDNFGSGNASINYLKEFPLHTLKIGRSFIQELKDTPADIATISALITLGRGFNLRVVAEGVETQEQFELLRRLRCEEMQGYEFSHPLTAQEATQFLSSYNAVRASASTFMG